MRKLILFLFLAAMILLRTTHSTDLLASSKNLTNGDKYILHARMTETPPQLDGSLQDPVWSTVRPAGGFIQKQPDEGRPATEQTEVRVLYDRENLYIGVMCFDSDPDKIIANIKRRDSKNITENDHIKIMLDTFKDRRSGIVFVTNPLGARLDMQIRKEGIREGRNYMNNPNVNKDWNGLWQVQTAILSNGWAAEIVIPLCCLRYHEHPKEGWGINILRNIRRKNEESTWAPLSRSFDFNKISMAGTLTGLDELEKGLRLQIKPYVLANQVSRRNDAGELKHDLDFDGGLDIKIGLTANMTADVTVNTDFSQVEADDQQINLTRFDLFYPEKREFFLENAAIFNVGTSDDAMLFFSRRIGLTDDGQQIPLIGGVKVAGKAGKYNVGLINLQTRAKNGTPSNNFTVARVSRDVLRNSAIGVLVTNRQSTESGDYNRSFTVDGDLVFSDNLSLGGYLAMTQTPGVDSGNKAGKIGFQWKSDNVDTYGYFIDIQDHFNPEMGFMKRSGIRKSQIHLGYTPEPAIPGVRRLNPHMLVDYTTDQKNRLLLRETHLHLQVDFINGGQVGLQWNENHEFVDVPFLIREDVTIPIAIYTDHFWQAEMKTDKSRNLYTDVKYRWGEFYSGKTRKINVSGGFRPLPSFNGEVSLEYNDVDLPWGAFINHLVRSKLVYSFSTRLSLMSLIQWNSDTDDINMNIRLHFIHTPGSDFFLVYNERRLVEGLDIGIQDRTIAAKFNYLFNI